MVVGVATVALVTAITVVTALAIGIALGVGGSLVGAIVANEYANQWFGKNPTDEENFQEALKGVFWDNIFSGIYNIFKWS